MKKWMSLVLAACMLLACMGTAFAADVYRVGEYDVPYDEDAAQRLRQLGLFYGTGDGYALDEAVTRAQAAVMVLRMMGEERNISSKSSVETQFSDMRGHWAEGAVAHAYALGYVNGTSADTFEPERGVTGREFVKMLLSAMGYEGVTIENAYDKGVEAQLLVNNFTKAAVQDASYALNRNDMVSICEGALLAKTADGTLLKDVLVEKGVFTSQQFDDVMLCVTQVPVCVTPPPQETRGFEWKLNTLMLRDKNYMFSPLSIKLALAMAANGAEGETQQEILSALGIDDLDAFNAQVQEKIAAYGANEDVRLSIANSVWLNRDYAGAQSARFNSGFLKLMADYYGAEADTVTNADGVEKINGWIEQNTNGKIKDVLQDSNFLAALVNAVYFKGAWLQQFREEMTAPDTFTSSDGSEKEVDFMHQTGYFDYYENNMVQMVRLPYEDTDIAMYIALPSVREIDLDRYIEKMEPRRVALSIPKFKVGFDTELKDMLGQLGIKTAFSPENARFTNMIDEYPYNIFLDKVIHKTYIDVDENGTEAAAVTVGLVGTGSVPTEEPIEFTADGPFTYFIYDEANGEILFLGRYAYAE